MEAKKPTRDVAMAWCICGRSDAIGGRTHTCRHPDGPRWSEVNPHKPAMPEPVTHNPITHTSVTHNATHTVPATASQLPQLAPRSKAAERQARYRAKHAEHLPAAASRTDAQGQGHGEDSEPCMTARTKTKKTAKASAKHTKPRRDAAPTNGTMLEQQEANDSAPTLAATPRANGQRKPPVPYSDELGDLICQRLRNGETLRCICKSEDMPTESTVREWASEATSFAANYARARELGYAKMADEVIALSDGLEAGTNRFDPGVVQRHRLMVDSRKWILAKCLPKIYGDRIDARLADANGEPLQIQATVAIRALIEALPELGVTTGLLALAVPAAAGVVEAPAAPSEPEGGR